MIILKYDVLDIVLTWKLQENSGFVTFYINK